MAKKRSSKPSSKLSAGVCEIGLKIPTGTLNAIRGKVTAGTSISSIIRDVIEEVFGEGKPAPSELGMSTQPADETWARVAVYCSERTRERGVMEISRRGLDRTGATKPRGIAPAVAWLLIQRFGGAE